MIKAIPFETWHAVEISSSAQESFSGDKELLVRLDSMSKSPATIMHTLVQDGDPVRILGIIGLFIYWPGVAEAFAFISKKIKSVPVAFSKSVIRIMNFYYKNLKLRRLQIYVREGFKREYAWANFLGFKEEGLMKNWGPEGASYFLLAKCGEGA